MPLVLIGVSPVYAKSFGLRDLPFNNTPDPRFFYPTPDHEEAVATLIYAVGEGKGYVLLTGEVGTGKTLVSRMMLRHFQDRVAFATVNHSCTSAHDLIRLICAEFELNTDPNDSTAALIHRLQEFLLKRFATGTPVVLVLDEAHNLPRDAFELLRTIGNLESDDAKLLQVVIVGQQELRARFQAPDMRQLRQRLFRSCHLPALTREQCGGYIRHRLQVAGATEEIFDESAIDAIFEFTRGLPREINTVCDNAMLSAYSADRTQLDAEFVQTVIKQMLPIGRETAAALHVPSSNPGAMAPAPSRPGPVAPAAATMFPPSMPVYAPATIESTGSPCGFGVHQQIADVIRRLESIVSVDDQRIRAQQALGAELTNVAGEMSVATPGVRALLERLDSVEQRLAEQETTARVSVESLEERVLGLGEAITAAHEQSAIQTAEHEKLARHVSRFARRSADQTKKHEEHLDELKSQDELTVKRLASLEARVAGMRADHAAHIQRLEQFASAMEESRFAAAEAFNQAMGTAGPAPKLSPAAAFPASATAGHGSRGGTTSPPAVTLADDFRFQRLSAEAESLARQVADLDGRVSRVIKDSGLQVQVLERLADAARETREVADEARHRADEAIQHSEHTREQFAEFADAAQERQARTNETTERVSRMEATVERLSDDCAANAGKLESFADTVRDTRRAAGESFEQAVKTMGKAEELARRVNEQVRRLEQRVARADGHTAGAREVLDRSSVAAPAPAKPNTNRSRRLDDVVARSRMSAVRLQSGLHGPKDVPSVGMTDARVSADAAELSPAGALAREMAGLADMVVGAV